MTGQAGVAGLGFQKAAAPDHMTAFFSMLGGIAASSGARLRSLSFAVFLNFSPGFFLDSHAIT
jgi:hypothetical protein